MELNINKIVNKRTVYHHKGEGKYCGNTTYSIIIDDNGLKEVVKLNGEDGGNLDNSHGGVECFVVADFVPDMDESYKDDYRHTFTKFGYEFETERVIYNCNNELKLSVKRLTPCP